MGFITDRKSKRNYVDDPDHGVPFLTTLDMLQADLLNLPLISKKMQIRANCYLKVKKA